MVRFGLTVVRHGETRYNKDKILQGQGVDEPLSATGFRQADAAGLFLSNVKFTHVFSSDLLRAKQTAATILGKNKFCKDLEIKYDARLRERKYGVAEGRPLTDLKAMAKAAGEQCPSFTPSGGETLDEVRERARDFFEFLCQLAVELEQKEQDVHGAASRSSGASEEQLVFPWTNHCSETELTSGNGGASKILDASMLVVSHGAYMRNWIGYFVSDLNCTLPTNLTKSQLSSVSPNTGVSHFIIKLENGNLLKPEITCVCLNQDSHLVDVGAECVAPKVF